MGSPLGTPGFHDGPGAGQLPSLLPKHPGSRGRGIAYFEQVSKVMLELKVLESSDLTEVTIYGPYLNRYRTRWMMQSLAEWHRQRQERGEKPDGCTLSSFLAKTPVHFNGGLVIPGCWGLSAAGHRSRGLGARLCQAVRALGLPSWLPRSYLCHLQLLRGLPEPVLVTPTFQGSRSEHRRPRTLAPGSECPRG